MALIDEELLEPLARLARFMTGIKYIPKKTPITLVDLGCGTKARFYFYSKKKGVKLKNYVGLDPLIKIAKPPKARFIKKALQHKIPLPQNSAECVVGFAFIEHVKYPKDILKEIIRILKKDGVAIITTPTPKAKRLLEFLAFKSKLLSTREIDEHENYFDKKQLMQILKKEKGNVKILHKYFEFGLNNLLILRKTK